jgi:hypothetical protein
MEYLQLAGVVALVFVVGLSLELCWAGYPLWNAWRHRRIAWQQAHNCIAVVKVSTPFKAIDRSQDMRASAERNSRLAA